MTKFVATLAVFMLFVAPAFAADVTTTPAADLVPPQAATLDGQLPEGEYPILRLTPDKIEVIRLDRDATNVIVGNNKHLVVVMETPRQVLLVPRIPGATHFQALDDKGNTIMERAVIVAAPKQDYVRVRRTCGKESNNCKEFSVFYCPDMCHPIALTQDDKAAAPTIAIPEKPASSPTPPEMVNDGVPVTPETTPAPVGEAPAPDVAPETTGVDSQ